MGEIVRGNIFYLTDDLSDGSQKLACEKKAYERGEDDCDEQCNEEDLIKCFDPFQTVVIVTGYYYDKSFLPVDPMQGKIRLRAIKI